MSDSTVHYDTGYWDGQAAQRAGTPADAECMQAAREARDATAVEPLNREIYELGFQNGYTHPLGCGPDEDPAKYHRPPATALSPLGIKRHILDSDGRIARWFATGRGVRVWMSEDVNDPRVTYTPADAVKPHWASEECGGVLDARHCLIFQPVGVVNPHTLPGKKSSWPDSAAGWEAAEKACPEPSSTDSLGCRYYNEYTIEGYTLRADATGLGTRRVDGRAMAIAERVGIIEWHCTEVTDEPMTQG